MTSSGASASSAVRSVTAHLTGPDIATLFTSPVTILAAPGGGKAIVPIVAASEFHPDAGVWSVNTAGLYYSGSVPTVGQVAAETFSGALRGNGTDLVAMMQNATPSGANIARAGVTNRALRVGAGAADPTPISTIVTKTILDPGSGYAPGDTGTIDGPAYAGAGDATYVVNTVGGGGEVLTATITNHGAGYERGSGYGTVVATGGGNGQLGIQIDTVTDPGGDLYLTVLYTIVDTHS